MRLLILMLCTYFMERVMKKISILILAIFLVACSHSSKSLNSFVQAINEEDFETAYSYFDESLIDDAKGNGILEQLKNDLVYIEDVDVTNNHYKFVGKVKDITLEIVWENHKITIFNGIPYEKVSDMEKESSSDHKEMSISQLDDILINGSFESLNSYVSEENYKTLLANIETFYDKSSLDNLGEVEKLIVEEDHNTYIQFNRSNVQLSVKLVQGEKLNIESEIVVSDITEEPVFDMALYEEHFDELGQLKEEYIGQAYETCRQQGHLLNDYLLKGSYRKVYGLMNEKWLSALSLESFTRFIELNMKNIEYFETDYSGYHISVHPENNCQTYVYHYTNEIVLNEKSNQWQIEVSDETSVQNISFYKWDRDFNISEIPDIHLIKDLSIEFYQNLSENMSLFKARGYEKLSNKEYEELLELFESMFPIEKGSHTWLGAYLVDTGDKLKSEVLLEHQDKSVKLIILFNRDLEVEYYTLTL